MRINEILTESEIHQLDEGPMLDKAGTLVGKAVGGAAKGVGAVAGGIAGIGRAFKKGYAGGKAVVGGDPSPNADEPAAPAKPAAAPAAAPAAGGAPAAPAAAPADTTAAPAAAPAAPADTTAAPAAEVPVKKKRAPKKPAAPSQAEIDADRERIMGVTSDSIIRTHTSLAETLMQAIAKEKRRMVAEGKISIFRK